MKPRLSLVAALFAAACAQDIVGVDVPVAVALDFLPFPAVVAGDTLRDSTGAVAPVRARAFNYLGEELPEVSFRYLVLDRGARVDTLTGIVVGDSIRETPVRVVALFGNLQTQTQQLAVVPPPDSLDVTRGVDTLVFSLADTTQNVSQPLSVRLLGAGSPPPAIRSWIISYQVIESAAPGLVTIVEGPRATSIDTTATDGTASRQVRLHVDRLVPGADSVVLQATARYRGTHVRGSPARLVVHLRPPAP